MQELLDAAKDRDLAVFGIADLKKFFTWAVCGGIAIFIAAGQFFYSRLAKNTEDDQRRDVAIAKIQDSLEHSTQSTVRLQSGLDKQQEIGAQMLLEITKLSGKMAATEEITRNTQQRLETLTDYIRNNHNPKKEVLESADSIYSPRGIQR